MFAVSTVLAALVFYIKSQHSPYPIGFWPCEMLQCPQDQSQAPSSPGQSAANPENPSKNRISPSLTTHGPPQESSRDQHQIITNYTKTVLFEKKLKKLQACKRPGIPKASNCLLALSRDLKRFEEMACFWRRKSVLKMKRTGNLKQVT